MLSKKQFFQKYSIGTDEFQETGLQWNELKKIHNDYLLQKPLLEPVAGLLVGWLRLSPQCHAISWRIKNQDHLIEKIIRLSKEKHEPFVTLNTYTEKLNDLIGVRLIHKFKEEWENIHDWIILNLPIVGEPEAHVHKLDSQEMIADFEKKGIKIKIKEVGYRSLHYNTNFAISKKHYNAEIQVRTLYEEAWGEVDHAIRYPLDQGNARLNQAFEKASCAAGLADGLGTLAKLYLDEKNLKKFKTREAKKKRVTILTKIENTHQSIEHFINEIKNFI